MSDITTLANIERRIAYHIQGAYSNVIEVGRCLIEAKESGLVPYGQWEAWVNRVAGMNERSAQRLMKAAREVAPESAMAKLPISKIQAILALPEPQREAVAEKAVEELAKCFLLEFGEDTSFSFGRCAQMKSFNALYDGLNSIK